MTKCHKCLSENPDGKNYCGTCGERLSEASPSRESHPSKPKSISQKIIAADRDISNTAKSISKRIKDQYG